MSTIQRTVESLKCPLCGEMIHSVSPKLYSLHRHFIGHFQAELTAHTDGKLCRLCGKNQPWKNLLRHVGIAHGILFQLLPSDVVSVLQNSLYKSQMKLTRNVVMDVSQEDIEDVQSVSDDSDDVREVSDDADDISVPEVSVDAGDVAVQEVSDEEEDDVSIVLIKDVGHNTTRCQGGNVSSHLSETKTDSLQVRF